MDGKLASLARSHQPTSAADSDDPISGIRRRASIDADARTLEMPRVRPEQQQEAVVVALPRPERITLPPRAANADDNAELINASPIGSTSYRFIAPRTGRRAK
jgi:hypothetical protein